MHKHETTQCPGYFERDVQEIIEKNGPAFGEFYCALCGQQVIPVNKDGGWIPRYHRVASQEKCPTPHNGRHQLV
jgi:hypothetical protein